MKLWKRVKQALGYEGIDETKMSDWLSDSFCDDGFQSYFKKRDLIILKSLALANSWDDVLRLQGKRLELLQLLAEAREAKKSYDKQRATASRDKPDNPLS